MSPTIPVLPTPLSVKHMRVGHHDRYYLIGPQGREIAFSWSRDEAEAIANACNVCDSLYVLARAAVVSTDTDAAIANLAKFLEANP